MGRYKVLAVCIVLASVLLSIFVSLHLGSGYSATMNVIVRDPRTTGVFSSDTSRISRAVRR